MSAKDDYLKDRDKRAGNMAQDEGFQNVQKRYQRALVKNSYTKNFTWMGFPIIQYPTDLMAMQEIIYNVRPEYIIECGCAFGGMLVFYASMLNMLKIHGGVVGIDTEFRKENIRALRTGRFAKDILLIERDSTDAELVYELSRHVMGKKVLVSLDSNHTYEHVLKELEAYGTMVSPGSYLVVFDTEIEEHWPAMNHDRPWGPKSNPAMAVREYLLNGDGGFDVDYDVENHIGITAAKGGWLKRRGC